MGVGILREHLFQLEDWVAHHINLGAAKVFFYDNSGTTGSDRMTSAFSHNGCALKGISKRGVSYTKETAHISDEGVLEIVKKLQEKYLNRFERLEWKPIGKNGNIVHGQAEAYAHFVEKFENLYEWGIFIDLDEYLMVHQGKNISETLKAAPQDVSLISIPEVRSRHIWSYPDRKIPDEIPIFTTKIKSFPKTLVRLNHVYGTNVHSDWSVAGKSISFPAGQLYLLHFNVGEKFVSAGPNIKWRPVDVGTESIDWSLYSNDSFLLKEQHTKTTVSRSLDFPVLFKGIPPSNEITSRVRYAAMSVDENPVYMEFVLPVMKQWSSIGIEPVVAILSDRDENVRNEYGQIMYIKKHPTLPTWFQSLFARIYITKYLNEITAISDIDMFPLDRRYYDYCASFIPDNGIVMSHTKYPRHAGVSPYVFSYPIANGSTMAKFFNLNQSFFDFMEFVSTSWMVAWHSDEYFLGDMIRRQPSDLRKELTRSFSSGVAPYRVYRNTSYTLPEPPVDFHSPRPYKKHSEYIESILLKYTKKPLDHTS